MTASVLSLFEAVDSLHIDDAALAAFATGVLAGLVFGQILLRLPRLAFAVTLLLASGAVYVMVEGGIDGLLDAFRASAAWVMVNFPFVKGLTTGKLFAAFLHMSGARPRRR